MRNRALCWCSALIALCFMSTFLVKLDYKGYRWIFHNHLQIIQDLTGLLVFWRSWLIWRSLRVSNLRSACKVGNSQLVDRVSFQILSDLIFRYHCQDLYQARHLRYPRVWIHQEARSLGVGDRQQCHRSDAGVPRRHVPWHRSQPGHVLRGGGRHGQEGGGRGRWPLQPRLHQKVSGPGGKYSQCENSLQLREVSSRNKGIKFSWVLC